MKLSFGKRVLMFFHWLLSLLIAAALVLYVVKPAIVLDLYGKAQTYVDAKYMPYIGIGLIVIYAIFAIADIGIVFCRKRKDRGFITMDNSEAGRVRMSISAIEQMVRQSVNNIDGINDMRISIENLDDAIGITIAASIVGGSHVPTISMNMQRAIRQFVEMNCGVAVRTVSININSVAATADGKKRKGKAAVAQPAPEPIPAPAPVVEPEPVIASEPVTESEPAVEPEPVVEPVAFEAPAYEETPVADEAVEEGYTKFDSEE